MTRRILPAWLALALAGCGDTPAGEALRDSLMPPPIQAAALPAGPALLVSGGRWPTAFALVQDAGGRRLWRAEGGIALATDGARIVATAGLGQMLVATRFEGPDPLEDPRALLGRSAAARRTVDLQGAARDPASMRFGLLLECRLDGRAEAGFVLVTERCAGAAGGFTNRFWAAPATGAVQRSEQWVGDEVPTLAVEAIGP